MAKKAPEDEDPAGYAAKAFNAAMEGAPVEACVNYEDNDENRDTVHNFVLKIQKGVVYLFLKPEAQKEGGEPEQATSQPAEKALDKVIWSWTIKKGSTLDFLNVFDSMALNLAQEKNVTGTIELGDKTFDLRTMEMLFDGEKFELLKTKNNKRTRPKENKKSDATALV